MSLRSTVESYKQSKYLYNSISDIFDEFEDGKVSEVQSDTIISRTLEDINRLNNTLSKVRIQDLEQTYDKDTIEDVEHNVDFYYEAADYIEKYLLGKKYYNSLLSSISTYVKKLSPSPSDYDRYANTESELSKKFTAMLLHPNNINQFLNIIKRMSIGTMSANEFKKIFRNNKRKMKKIPTGKFESFQEYKN